VPLSLRVSRLGGVMVSVLAIGPKVRGVKPARSDGLLRAIKICSTPYFGEVKPPAPCRKTLRRVKKSLGGMNKNTSRGQTRHFLRPFLLLTTRWLLVGLPESCGGRRRSFSLSILFHHISPRSYITWGSVFQTFRIADHFISGRRTLGPPS
jgi:hypothetical protein